MNDNGMKQTDNTIQDNRETVRPFRPVVSEPARNVSSKDMQTAASETVQTGACGSTQAGVCGAADNTLKEKHEAVNAVCPACSSRHKIRSEKDKKALLTRLRKIEGQIRGLEKMVENDSYCPDILIQVSAANNALNSFSKVLLNSHIHSCFAEDIREGRDEAIDELCSLLQKLMK